MNIKTEKVVWFMPRTHKLLCHQNAFFGFMIRTHTKLSQSKYNPKDPRKVATRDRLKDLLRSIEGL